MIMQDEVRREIEEVHRFFVDWFNGTIDRHQLDDRFLPRFDPDLAYITPDGRVMRGDDLGSSLKQAYGNNRDFRIQIRDVEIRHEMQDHLLVTYTEWQAGAKASENAQNARFTTVLMSKQKPFRWLHIQETWLPEGVRAAGPFDF